MSLKAAFVGEPEAANVAAANIVSTAVLLNMNDGLSGVQMPAVLQLQLRPIVC